MSTTTPAPVGTVDRSASRDLRTAAVRSGLATDIHHGAVVPPIHLSSTFTFAGLGEPRQYDYTRSGNPTRDLLATALAELEGGTGAVVTSTGMSAIHVALQLLKPGDLLVAPFDCYGGTYRLLDACRTKGAFDVVFIDLSDPVARDAALDPAAERKPTLVWVETPSNPLLRITDVRTVVDKAHALGALVAVDNTFLSPALQRPLDLGADLVVHSTTKYLNGHSDVVGGAVIARDADVHEQMAWWANCLGVTGSPFDSFLTLRGVRTLHARCRSHLENAAAVVDRLVADPAIAKVYYPGLEDHPGHAVAKAQQSGFGAMVSFELAAEGDRALDAVRAFVDGLRCFSLAESLGGVESLIAHPASMTHAAMAAEARRAAGIGDNLLRLSIGIEAADDLVADLDAALGRVHALLDRSACVVPTAPTRDSAALAAP